MYLADCHTHSLCSFDCRAPLESMAEKAVALGLSHLYTTDHCDILDEDGNPLTHWDWSPILAQFQRTQSQYGHKLKLSLGLELAAIPENLPLAAEIVSGAPLDFIIGSIHNLSPAAGGLDMYYMDFTDESFCHQVLEDYFTSLLKTASQPYYDALGHIIYPLRYMNGRSGHHITFDRYQDQLDAVLRTVIETGHAIEVNTHCGDEVTDWRPILLRYRELGGELITLGSDAHRPENLALGLKEAQQLLCETGFRYQTIYKQRKPECITL